MNSCKLGYIKHNQPHWSKANAFDIHTRCAGMVPAIVAATTLGVSSQIMQTNGNST